MFTASNAASIILAVDSWIDSICEKEASLEIQITVEVLTTYNEAGSTRQV
jgi:hypothetical protein